MKKFILISLLFALALVLCACGAADKAEEPAVSEAPAATEAPVYPQAPEISEAPVITDLSSGADLSFLTKSAGTYEQITQDEAHDMMVSGAECIILDVRTEEEYAEKHIPGAICVPNETIGDTQPEELPDLTATILVYCRSGNRSKQAAQKLADIGYTDVREFGGINSWAYDTE